MDDPDGAAFAYDRYLEFRSPTLRLDAFDPLAVRADPVAMEALVRLGGALRGDGYDNEVMAEEPAATASRFALGFPVRSAALAGVLGADGVKALVKTTAAERKSAFVRSTFGIFAAGDLMILALPSGQTDAYLGHDTFALLRAIWREPPAGNVAVDLGSGTGFLAAALTTRYPKVVATDLVPSVTAAASITLALNARPGHGSVTCNADVAAGLRPGSADLVCANPPWVASFSGGAPPGSVYADGGPTGFELPRRFIREGAELLAPGGVGYFQFLRPDRADGGGYPIVLLRNELAEAGFKTDLLTSEVVVGKVPSALRILEVRRP